MDAMASHITSFTIVYSTVYTGADQRKHQSSASLAFVRGIHRGPVNSLHKWPVRQKMFPFDDVIMNCWLKQRSFCVCAQPMRDTYTKWSLLKPRMMLCDVSLTQKKIEIILMKCQYRMKFSMETITVMSHKCDASRIPCNLTVCSIFFRLKTKESLQKKLCIIGPFCEESTGHWWILLTKGQLFVNQVFMSRPHHFPKLPSPPLF